MGFELNNLSLLGELVAVKYFVEEVPVEKPRLRPLL
jgi:hypothetical protein